jgi:hypothetical protein
VVAGGVARMLFKARELPELNGECLDISGTAHGQLAARAGVPKRYYDRMVQDAPELWEHSLRTWWAEDRSRRLVRTFQPDGSEPGTLRAYLSDRYRTLDSLPFIEAVLETAEEVTGGRFQMAQAHVTDERCHVRIMTERREATAAGDEIQQGITLSNSEVGSGRMQVQPFAVVLSCTNGMVATRNYGRVHLGGELDHGMLERDTVEARARAVWLEVRDFVSAALSQDHLREFVRRIDAASGVALDAPARQVVANVVREFSLGSGTGGRLMERYLRDASAHGETHWGLVQATTYEAHQAPSWSEQVELEELGGRLLEMEAGQVQRLVSRRVPQKDLERLFSRN